MLAEVWLSRISSDGLSRLSPGIEWRRAGSPRRVPTQQRGRRIPVGCSVKATPKLASQFQAAPLHLLLDTLRDDTDTQTADDLSIMPCPGDRPPAIAKYRCCITDPF